MSDTAKLTEEICFAASEAGHRLFRNNSGVAKHVKGKRTWFVRYGVGPSDGGGGDLIGWTRSGRFASIEIKTGHDRQSDEQKKWEGWVRAGGGVAGVARSVADALAILDQK